MAATYETSRIKRIRATKAEVEVRREALLNIITDGRPMTVRQVFYQATVHSLVEKAETFRAGAASHPSTPAASDDGSQPAAPRARRAMRLRRYQQPVMLKTGFVQRVRRVARREGSRRRAGPRAGATGLL